MRTGGSPTRPSLGRSARRSSRPARRSRRSPSCTTATAAPPTGSALRILRDQALAEDAVQEAFLAVWRTASRFVPERGKASTWILTLVHRRAVDVVRREQRRRADSLEPAAGAGRRGRSTRTRSCGSSASACSRRCATSPTRSARRSSSRTTEASASRSSPRGSASRWVRSRAGCSPGLSRMRELLGEPGTEDSWTSTT